MGDDKLTPEGEAVKLIAALIMDRDAARANLALARKEASDIRDEVNLCRAAVSEAVEELRMALPPNSGYPPLCAGIRFLQELHRNEIARITADCDDWPPFTAPESAAFAARDFERVNRREPIPLWRSGTKVGRTLYFRGELVGMVDTVEMAAAIVEAMNGKRIEVKS